MKIRYHLFVAMLIFSTIADGQSQIRFPQADSIGISSFINRVEISSDIRIFYDSIAIAGKNISLKRNLFQNTEEAVQYLRRETGFEIVQYDYGNYVIIGRDSFAGLLETDGGTGNILTIGQVSDNPNRDPVVLNGTILDGKTGEAIIGATVILEGTQVGAVTNPFGRFRLELPTGYQTLNISSVGYQQEKRQLLLRSNGELSIELFEESKELEEITITATAADANVNSAQTGLTKLSMKGIKDIPAFMGETDIIKSIIMLPGVNTVGEGSSGFNVRGGETSQNLILLDEMIIFNPSHLFGFFTAFQGDLINDIEFYKGGIPSVYGGRMASVLQVNTKEGNLNRFQGKLSAGIISSRLSVEGPIKKNKGSIIAGARGSYLNWMLKRTKSIDLVRTRAGFGDYMVKANYLVNENDKITASMYSSWDNFQLASDTSYLIRNQAYSVKWDHIFKNGTLGQLSLVRGMNSTELGDETGYNAFTMQNAVNYTRASARYYYNIKKSHQVDIGAESIIYDLNPGSFIPEEENTVAGKTILNRDLGIESSLFISDEVKVSERFSVIAGIRGIAFAKTGPDIIYNYEDPNERYVSEITDSVQLSGSQVEKWYMNMEPRLSMRFSFGENTSVKLGFNRVNQYLHLITNSTTVVPTDFWMNSNTYIEPERSNQLSVGLFKNLNSNMYETSFEVYYKSIQNAIDYREGGNIFLNRKIEADLLNGKGKAYGAELFIKKNRGRLTGWLSYTYSRSLRRFDSDNPDFMINNGKYYPSNFDKPNDLSFVGQYALSKRIKINWNFVYGSGRPITAPDSKYSQVDVLYVLNYSERNQYRIMDYHRLDLGFTVDENLRNDKNVKTSWTFSIYNAYSRRNAFSVFFNNSGHAFKLSVLGTIFPSLTYNIVFL